MVGGITPEHMERVGNGLEAPASFISPEILRQDLIKSIRKYHPFDDISMVEKAHRIIYDAHKEQRCKSGEPYVIHPLCVAITLADLELDKRSIMADILHDVAEDTVMMLDEVAKEFSSEVALLVDGVMKLIQLFWSMDKQEVQVENLWKIFPVMAKDICVILIELADRLHNMRTLWYMTPEKQKEKARGTMGIYSLIVRRLGIPRIKIELGDLSLKYLEPGVYYDPAEKISLRKDAKETFVQGTVEKAKFHMAEAGIDARVEGRVKHFFSIYKKTVNQDKTLDQTYDLFTVWIIVGSVKNCYAVLGVIHELYRSIPGRFEDYIVMPKPNMYQSLHMILIGSNGRPFEIQIRTFEIHRTAKFGIVAYWKYKENESGQIAAGSGEVKLSWLRQIPEWQTDMLDNKEFLNLIRSDLDLFSDSAYCLIPSGDVENLPSGSTSVDLAYAVHSAMSNKMVGARVNGELVNIGYVIQNGDRIEIIAFQNSKGPSRDWLKLVKNTQARNKTNQWFRTELKEDNTLRGKEMIGKYYKAKGINFPDINKSEYMERVMKRYVFRDWDPVLASIGHGGLRKGQTTNRVVEEREKKLKKEATDTNILDGIGEMANKVPVSKRSGSGIMAKGTHDTTVRFSGCCSPAPGDEIVGFVTRDCGVSIHQMDCVNIINLPENERERLIDAEQQELEGGGSKERYSTGIQIYANNRTGISVDISRVFTKHQIDITLMNACTSEQGKTTIITTFDIHGVEELSRLTDKLRQVEDVLDIERTAG